MRRDPFFSEESQLAETVFATQHSLEKPLPQCSNLEKISFSADSDL